MSYQNPCRHHPNSPFTSSLVMREKHIAASLSPPASPLPGKDRPCTTQPPLSRAILFPASDGAQGGCNGGLRPTGSHRESALCIKRGSGYSPPGGLAKREAFAPKGAMIGGNKRDWQAYVGANPPCHTAGFRVEQINVVIPRVFTRASIQGSTPRTWGASLHQAHGENVGVSQRAHPITVPPPNGGIALV